MADLIKSGELAQRIKDLPSGVMPEILAHAEVGETVTCSNGETTLTEVAIDGTCIFKIPMFGVWTVVGKRTEDVLVDAIKRYEVDVKSIPVEYQQLEYIKSSGMQYIDLGFPATNNCKINAQLEYTAYASNEAGLLGACSRPSNGIYTFEIYARTSNKQLEVRYGLYSNSASNLQLGVINLNTRYSISTILNNTTIECIVNGTSKQFSVDNNKLSDKNLCLFAINDEPKPRSFGSLCLYEFSYENTGELKHSFIPCYEKSTGTEGMYDTVSKTFLANKGTGKFIRGPEVH